MEADRFPNVVIAELAALKYIVEQIEEISFLRQCPQSTPEPCGKGREIS